MRKVFKMKIIPLVKLPEEQLFGLTVQEYDEFQKLEPMELEIEKAQNLISLNYARGAEE